MISFLPLIGGRVEGFEILRVLFFHINRASAHKEMTMQIRMKVIASDEIRELVARVVQRKMGWQFAGCSKTEMVFRADLNLLESFARRGRKPKEDNEREK